MAKEVRQAVHYSNKKLAEQQRAEYRRQYLRSKDKRKRKGSSTPGKIKSPACQADLWKRYFAKAGRSYKHRDYPEWAAKHRGR